MTCLLLAEVVKLPGGKINNTHGWSDENVPSTISMRIFSMRSVYGFALLLENNAVMFLVRVCHVRTRNMKTTRRTKPWRTRAGFMFQHRQWFLLQIKLSIPVCSPCMRPFLVSSQRPASYKISPWQTVVRNNFSTSFLSSLLASSCN